MEVAILAVALLAALGWYFFFSKTKKQPADVAVDPKFRQGYDCIIVGAGVAGASLAYALGNDGRKVLVIERCPPREDGIAGELLQPGGYLKLVELGLEDCVEEIEAQRVLGYALFLPGAENGVAKLPYPLETYAADVAGRSFHNSRFVQRLRDKASSVQSVELIQGTVLGFVEHEGVVKGVHYKTGDKEHVVHAPITFVCDGHSSNLRKKLYAKRETIKPNVEVWSSFVGLVLDKCQLPFPNHGHVVLGYPSLVLFYPISNTEVRCLVDIPKHILDEGEGSALENRDRYLKEEVAPKLEVAPELRRAFEAALEDPSRSRAMDTKIMPAALSPKPGSLLLGDAFNMRHPLTGGGMTVALSDVVVLRNMLRTLGTFGDSANLSKLIQDFYTQRKPVASTINILAGALYRVFCSKPDDLMKEACFDYLRRGGTFSSGPVALLSGLNPQPGSLVSHFTAVAGFGFMRLVKRSFRNTLTAFCLLKDAGCIILPIIHTEGIWQMFFAELLKKKILRGASKC